MRLALTTPPPIEPVGLAEAKLQCSLGGGNAAWDDFLEGKIATARQLCEHRLRRSFIASGWTLYLDGFPTCAPRSLERLPAGRIDFPVADVVSVESITYLDAAGATQTLDPSGYQVLPGAPGRVIPAYGKSWPAHRRYPEAVAIAFTAGYGDEADDVPQHVRDAVLLFVQHFFEHRGLVVTGTIVTPIPDTVQALLDPAEWGSYP